MNTNTSELLGNITEFLKSEAKTETIIGEQFTLGAFSCVPVMSIGMGFGSVGGEGKGKGSQSSGEGEGGGSGAAGGMGINPVGFLVTKDDQISFIPAHNTKGLAAAFEKVPDLIEKFMAKKANGQSA